MKLTLTIDKSGAEDCPYDCVFRNMEDPKRYECILFHEEIRVCVYAHDHLACDKCQELYRKQQGEQQ